MEPFQGNRRVAQAADAPQQNPMPPLDINATADRVVALLNTSQGVEGMRLLEEQRRDQPQAVQESLDRMIASRGAEALAVGTVRNDVQRLNPAENPDAAALNAGLDRLTAATRAPRFPAEAEMTALNATQRYDVYASIIETRGNDAAREALRNGDRVILGLRQENSTVASMTPDNPATPRDESRSGTGVYDDRLAVLGRRNPPGGGDPEVWQFNRANTEPTAQYDAHAQPGPNRREPYTSVQPWRRAEGEDVNNDRVPDLGRMREGSVEMLRTTHPRPGGGPDDVSFRPTPEAVRNGVNGVQRDTNADGFFNHNDINGLQNLNDTFKIHRGSRGNTDSAGCQTIHYDDYDGFIRAARGNPGQTRWQYVLTETTPGQAPVQGQQQGQQQGQPQGLPAQGAPLPANRAELPDDPLMQRIHRAFDDSGALTGLGEQQRRNVLAGTYQQFAGRDVDTVGVYGNGTVVVGFDSSRMQGQSAVIDHRVEIDRVKDIPAQTSLAAVERSERERTQAEANPEMSRGTLGIGARA